MDREKTTSGTNKNTEMRDFIIIISTRKPKRCTLRDQLRLGVQGHSAAIP